MQTLVVVKIEFGLRHYQSYLVKKFRFIIYN